LLKDKFLPEKKIAKRDILKKRGDLSASRFIECRIKFYQIIKFEKRFSSYMKIAKDTFREKRSVFLTLRAPDVLRKRIVKDKFTS
jgi:hypothetical protein